MEDSSATNDLDGENASQTENLNALNTSNAYEIDDEEDDEEKITYTENEKV